MFQNMNETKVTIKLFKKWKTTYVQGSFICNVSASVVVDLLK
jgi:hypothetical protein